MHISSRQLLYVHQEPWFKDPHFSGCIWSAFRMKHLMQQYLLSSSQVLSRVWDSLSEDFNTLIEIFNAILSKDMVQRIKRIKGVRIK